MNPTPLTPAETAADAAQTAAELERLGVARVSAARKLFQAAIAPGAEAYAPAPFHCRNFVSAAQSSGFSIAQYLGSALLSDDDLMTNVVQFLMSSAMEDLVNPLDLQRQAKQLLREMSREFARKHINTGDLE